jgi:hypothetical protein
MNMTLMMNTLIRYKLILLKKKKNKTSDFYFKLLFIFN